MRHGEQAAISVNSTLNVVRHRCAQNKHYKLWNEVRAQVLNSFEKCANLVSHQEH